MPEQPEVEKVRRGLARSIEGARIVCVETRRAGLRYPFAPDLARRLEGKIITHLGRRAKYLLIMLDDETVMISHLGMSGSWRVEKEPRQQKHDHLIVQLKQHHQLLYLAYHDPRRFGFILLSQQSDLDRHPMLQNLGVEPLSNALCAHVLEVAFKGKKTPLKSVLLDQRIIAGLGNIYVCEVLWQAQLSPFMPAGKVAVSALSLLVVTIRDVLNRAVAAGGSTLRDHAQIDGSSGYFQHQFNVYGQENVPCPRCGVPILRTVQSGRSTFYCAACQPLIADVI